jgi:hypothetical protein
VTDSATRSASPPVKSYHGIEIIPIGRRFDPKRSFLFGVARTAISFSASRKPFSPRVNNNPPKPIKFPPLL